ncbi:hypothetical protein SS1G_10722 [Sclerotinia sclerotiorum 1980 UF-70]|uniref:Mitochondrial resolvase Ydc2 catalytic domain-containing protein n=2 Tax=Sclerotinia sclerotiorum (strain ATCC 18683 / 1980 / Ss-1) TaxID=665079 RepID=A7EZF5_SCLS1|nr:hypothetical protein SS1G_10722 [Sclerotinia sclerotiorum 1980 UF-70]APA12268.1 hypothetical protein sscle_09g070380 [Sclerotinia sclerotiorum 1980 UF-70]EDN94847.1 hypothetical protein SS1G_10722 [Sclerotinia sclerotiorum 1980 UF-70]
MAITIPSTLKAVALKQIAFKCGISISGTKPVLTQRIQDELPKITLPGADPSSATSKPLRILSIDMGIRNFSYCLLEIPLPSKSPKNKRKSTPPIPILQSWQKLSLLPQAPPNTNPATNEKPRNEFTPAILSTAAYTLLRHTLLPLSPTHILIERQRFRTHGAKQILEWTIRVNMLESMLWATLKTLSEEKVWEGEVIEIAPRKVGTFWVEESGLLDGEEGEEFRIVRNTKEVYARSKGAKIDLVRRWLEGGEKRKAQKHNEMVIIGSQQVQDIKERYTEKWDRKAGRANGNKPKSKSSHRSASAVAQKKKEKEKKEEMGKLDDLADSLLQGMAWLKWQENRKRALEEGVEILLDY